ncbi:hypothetical protein D7Z26_16615 [Cohnella endophytica]|uniref:Fibronectin type-III domain-containing protein n=1 Tax=Cohnella endophytica TaxID=2419778 RepID=A0A494XL25_9BACL|nr:InlB B-repeat-containing protein [Cohnella endophytica]RKP51415.1 hypothetical protein D7Z26_16615 [Cohnella endophytica]
MKRLASRLKIGFFRSGKIALACLLVFMFAPFMGAGKTVHATSSDWAAVGQTEQPANVQTLLKSNDTLYAGTGNGSDDVWSNRDGTWTQMIGSPARVRSLLVDADGTLYAGAWGDGNNVSMYTASDGWKEMPGSPSNVYSLIDVDGTIYAGASNGSSNDVWTYTAIAGWTKMMGSPGDAQALTYINGTLYAGTGSNGVWSNSNGSWTQISNGVSNPKYVASLVNVNGMLYAAGTPIGDNRSVWTYNNSNSTWTPITGAPARVKTLRFASGTLYAGTASGSGYDDVWTYTTGGGWAKMNGAPGSVYALLDDNGTLYAGTQTGRNDVWTFSNGTWTQMGVLPGDTNTLYSANGTLYAGLNKETNAVWAYTTRGGWTQMSGSPGYVYALTDVNGTLYAGTCNDDNDNDVWAYDTTATTPEWTQMTISHAPSNVYSLLNVDGTLYAGTNNGSNDIWTYDTTATSPEWTQMTASHMPGYVNTLLNVNGTIYAGNATPDENDVWTYDTSATTPEWTQMTASHAPSTVTSLLEVNGTLYAGTFNGGNDVWTYDTSATTPEWTQMTTSNAPNDVNALLIVNGKLFAGTDNGSNDVWSYSNGTWEQVSGSPSQLHALLEIGGTLYAAGVNGVVQLTAPGTPANLQAGSTTFDSTTLSWDAVTGATGYYLYENGDSTAITAVTGTSHTVSGLTPNTSYTFTVSAFNAIGESEQSDELPVQTLNADATLTSTIGTVSTDGTADESITDIPHATTLDEFKAAIRPTDEHATFKVYDEDGITEATILATGKKVIVTGRDGTTKITYTLTVVPAYLVTYNGNGASGNAPADSSPYAQGDTVTVYGNIGTLAKTGYTFNGWNTAANGSGTSYAAGSTFTMSTSNVTLYAMWTINTYTVSFNSNGGTAISDQPVDYNDRATKPADPTKSGNTFGGWYSDSELTTPFDFTASVTTNKTLYAKWTANTHTVTFNSNGGSAVGIQTVNDNGTATKPTDPTKSGNTFGGWYSDSELATPFDFTASVTTNKTLYAKWTLNPAGGAPPSTSSNDTVISTDGTLTLPVGKTGKVSLGDVINITIPADALGKELKLTIQIVADAQKLLTKNDVLASPVFEILKNFPENFGKEITLTFTFDPKSLGKGQQPSVFYYDEAKKVWVKVGGTVNGNTITVKVNHFTKYAVLGEGQNPDSTTDTKQPINFNDISGHWAEASIKQAVSAGIVSGYSDGTFNPNRIVTRAEFAVMLANALKLQGDGSELAFTDKGKIGSWAQKSVAQVVQASILTGYKDGTFRPDAEITRLEMAVMIAKALGQPVISTTATDFADDKDIAVWAKGAVGAMRKLNIIRGKGVNVFAPGDKTTRAESVTVLLRMLAQKDK